MTNYKKALNFEEFTVGQSWTDGIGTIEITKIRIPTKQNLIKDIIIEIQLTSLLDYSEIMKFNSEGLRAFLLAHKKRLWVINPIKEIETEDYKNNRFDIID